MTQIEEKVMIEGRDFLEARFRLQEHEGPDKSSAKPKYNDPFPARLDHV